MEKKKDSEWTNTWGASALCQASWRYFYMHFHPRATALSIEVYFAHLTKIENPCCSCWALVCWSRPGCSAPEEEEPEQPGADQLVLSTCSTVSPSPPQGFWVRMNFFLIWIMHVIPSLELYLCLKQIMPFLKSIPFHRDIYRILTSPDCISVNGTSGSHVIEKRR